jgi:hypothetical protein
MAQLEHIEAIEKRLWSISDCRSRADRKFPDFPPLLPPKRLAAAFDDHVSSLRKQMETLERENELLAKARDLLLSKLMNGEVAV